MKVSTLFAAVSIAAASLIGGSALATPFTNTSPTGVDVTSVGATTVGGIVIDLVGSNGAHVVSQIAANSLFNGSSSARFTIGSQTGFGSAVTGALGGGLQAASFRFTLFDGDTAAGNFDFNVNALLVNGFSFGNWSTVIAQQTSDVGAAGASGFSTGGFRDNLLDTGWFSSNNAALMSSLYGSLLSTSAIKFELTDQTPGDNVLDFTRGVNGSLINVGQAPVVASGVPEPTSIALLGIGLLGFGAMRKKSKA